MLGALSLLQGARADSRRSGQADGKTVVEGTFDISGFPRIAPLLQQLEIEECQQQEMLMRREISASGRSRAFINDTPVPLATMARVAASVIDIHSQHANLLLSDPAYQLSLLDAYADNAEIRDRYSGLYTSYRDLRARINALKEAAARARENEEFIAFRLDHLRKLKPLPGEQEALEARQRLLSDASAISENLSGAAAALSQADAGVLDSLAGAEALLRKVNLGLFADNPDSASLLPRLESARLELADIAASLESMLETVDADPSELEKSRNASTASMMPSAASACTPRPNS